MVFYSVARYYSECVFNTGLPHIIISNLEHDSVDLTVREMVDRKLIGEQSLSLLVHGQLTYLLVGMYYGISSATFDIPL